VSDRRGSGDSSPIEIEYDAVAEVSGPNGAPVVAFHFINSWARDVPDLAARIAMQQELRQIQQTLRVAYRELAAAKNEEEWRGVNERYLSTVERYNRLKARLEPHELRKRPGVKAVRWAWRAGESELAAHGLGPILLWPGSTQKETALKMFILGVRAGVAIDDRSNEGQNEERSSEAESALADVLGLNRKSWEVPEVLSRVLFSGRRYMGYIGDLSPTSFRAYLLRILSTVRAEARGSWASPDALGGTSNEEDASAHLLRSLRAKRQAAPTDEDGDRYRVEPIRLPHENRHPWTEGRPALLSRVAVDYGIDPHIARSWVRAGQLAAQDCRWREELTLRGHQVAGTIEVAATERPVWETLCTKYLEKKQRKDELAGTSTARKKRAYRRTRKSGGDREKAARLVRELAKRAGLLDIPPSGLLPGRPTDT
jgi:hypothetical protein